MRLAQAVDEERAVTDVAHQCSKDDGMLLDTRLHSDLGHFKVNFIKVKFFKLDICGKLKSSCGNIKENYFLSTQNRCFHI